MKMGSQNNVRSIARNIIDTHAPLLKRLAALEAAEKQAPAEVIVEKIVEKETIKIEMPPDYEQFKSITVYGIAALNNSLKSHRIDTVNTDLQTQKQISDVEENIEMINKTLDAYSAQFDELDNLLIGITESRISIEDKLDAQIASKNIITKSGLIMAGLIVLNFGLTIYILLGGV